MPPRGLTSALPFVLTILLAVVIAVLTLTPVSAPGVPGTDKSHHFLAFAALAFPLSAYRPRLAPWLVLAAIGYGGLIELIQPQFGRDREFMDFVSDAAGALAGATTGATIHWLRLSAARG